jgi:hypothetical protein
MDQPGGIADQPPLAPLLGDLAPEALRLTATRKRAAGNHLSWVILAVCTEEQSRVGLPARSSRVETGRSCRSSPYLPA